MIGERILAASPALREVGRIVRSSHERWDGAGYPDRLCGETIPLEARIVAACDAYSAMLNDRPYRPSLTHDGALAEIRRHPGAQLDPAVADALCVAAGELAAAERLDRRVSVDVYGGRPGGRGVVGPGGRFTART